MLSSLINTTCLGLAFLSTVSVFAADLEPFKSAVVRIVATKDGSHVTGTGFIVSRPQNSASILTAAHVVEGAQTVDVEFYSQRNVLIPAKVLQVEGGDPTGLALLSVSAQLPNDALTLSLDSDTPIKGGDAVEMIGFPAGGGAWSISKVIVSGRRGKALILTPATEEGASGAPLLAEGRVVGIVSDSSQRFSYAVPAAVAKYVLESWGVSLQIHLRSQAASLTPQAVKRMVQSKGFSIASVLREELLTSAVTVPASYRVEELVLVDMRTGLMWLRQSELLNGFEESSERVVQLNETRKVSFYNWRLPTLEEVSSLLLPVAVRDDASSTGPLTHPALKIGKFQPEHEDHLVRSADSCVRSSGSGRWSVDFYRSDVECAAGWGTVLFVRTMTMEELASYSRP